MGEVKEDTGKRGGEETLEDLELEGPWLARRGWGGRGRVLAPPRA